MQHTNTSSTSGGSTTSLFYRDLGARWLTTRSKKGIRRSNKNRWTLSNSPIYGWWRPAWNLSFEGRVRNVALRSWIHNSMLSDRLAGRLRKGYRKIPHTCQKARGVDQRHSSGTAKPHKRRSIMPPCCTSPSANGRSAATGLQHRAPRDPPSPARQPVRARRPPVRARRSSRRHADLPYSGALGCLCAPPPGCLLARGVLR